MKLFLVFAALCFHSDGALGGEDDPKECKIADCTQDLAVELCPKTCSESKICKVADCTKPDSLQTCPRTCAVTTKDGSNGKDMEGKTIGTENKKGNTADMATQNGRENIYLQISDITVPTYGYKEIDFSDSAKCIPNKAKNDINVYGAMTGYDAIQGNPMNSLVDPGIKGRIFLHDCKFGYFDFVSDVRNNLECDSDFSMKTIESMDQYEQERKGSNEFSAGAAISAKGGFGAIKASASASYTRSSNSDQMASEKVLEKYNGEITRAKATCLTHSVTIADNVRPVFTPDFIHHLEDMDAATRSTDEKLKKEAISKFLNEFGTHYSKETRLGAELIYERRFEKKGKSIQEKKERNECVKDEASVSVGVESTYVDVSAKGHYNNKDCEGMKSGSDFSNNEGFEAVKTISRGSRPTDMKKWIDATFTPIAIKRKLDDISNLFQDRWMTKSVFYGFERNLNGSDIKKMYDKYIEQYCEMMLYGILDENCNVIACTDSNYKCYNGGTCINFEGSPRCDCPAETYGKFCEIAWLLVAEEKTCKDTKGVTIFPTEPFTNIVDCASACRAKLQNKMFAFENKDGCKNSETGCQCHCVESITNDCTLTDEPGLNVYKFRTETASEYVLTDTQEECSDIESGTISSVNSADGCQNAVKSLGVVNQDVIIEDQPSVPKGCYVYKPSNTLYFNQHSTGLDKDHWKYDTRMVCKDFEIALDSSGGCGEIEVTSDLEIQKCRTGIYKIQQQELNQKPVFKHESKQEYLFYMKKGKGFWMFGSEVGVDNGGVINGLCNDGDDNIVNVPIESACPSRWFYWKKSTASWLIDSSMSVRCPDSSKGDATKERALLASEEAATCPAVNVLHTNHSKGNDGRYFFFTNEDFSKMVGNENWDAMQFEVVQAGSDSWKGKVMVWNRESGSHGRKSEGSAAGDWKEGDTITLQTCIEKGSSPEDACQSSPGDLCLTLPCGVNANCDASSGDVKCSCPKNMVGDPTLKCEVFDSKYPCILTTPLECSKEAKKLGLEMGNKDYPFQENSNYKGCYYFGPKHKTVNKRNTAFFGTGGSIMQMAVKAQIFDSDAFWDSEWQNGKGYKSLTQQCLVADYNLISQGQKCSTVDSADYIVGGNPLKPLDAIAQICKTMSNKFSVDEDGVGYCHVGTRQTGRCEIQDDKTMDLYEIKYPGYALAREGFRCEDIGMKATEELESCKAALSTIQKVIPDIGISVNRGSFYNQPKGCYVANKKIYFNIDLTDSLKAGSQQVCSGPRCNGYPTTDWNCCNSIAQCGIGEGDCDTDDDCVGDLICGSSRDSSNNCKTEFIYSRSFWSKSADCCTEPECKKNADCNISSDPDKKICQAGRCIRCRGGGACCTIGEKCYEGEGDCDNDDECMPGLRCGVDNCRVKVSPWQKGTDCCYKPASCPVITVQKVKKEGSYFYSTKNELRELYGYDNWDGYTMDIIQEGDCGFKWVKGTEKEQEWTGCYTGEIIAWKKDGSGRRNCKKCAEAYTGKAGQWSSGDTIKSKACSLVDPCFNGEQDRYETGVDCGGDCKRKCSPELEREIPWLLSTASNN